MPIEEIEVSGYRSIRKFHLKFGRINLIFGANGCGKTNLYRAMTLLQAAAMGTLARSVAEEGGMPSIHWAGNRVKGQPVRVNLGVTTDRFEFQLTLGLPKPGESAFSLDPEIKEERLWYSLNRKRVPILDRGNTFVKIRDAEGTLQSFPMSVELTESALSEFRDPMRFPIVAAIRQEFLDWRFYHVFRTDPESPIRNPQFGSRTPILSSDGRDLAAALKTIQEIGRAEDLHAAIQDAFPGVRLGIASVPRFSLSLRYPEFENRGFPANELSDGTLKYLCLAAALLTPRPPLLIALNEPEGSLHTDLMSPLARLIAQAAERTQLWITTHSKKLAEEVKKLTGTEPIELEKVDGETRVVRKADAD